VPVITHDACGMGLAVTDGSGIKIPVRNIENSVRAFAEAIEFLYRNPSEIRRLSAGAIARSAELTWECNVKRFLEVYDRVIDAAQSQPAVR
jgi:glycosyltransferase involved in cell wall biosynthesis